MHGCRFRSHIERVNRMKIGDRIFVRGYIDEIRKDTVIIRNDGGYFGTVLSEVTGELPSAQPERKKGKWERHYCEDGNPDGWRWIKIEEAHEHLSYNKIAGMCSVSNNMPWMIVQRRGACNLITADRILDALGYQLVIVKKEDDT